MGLLSGQVTERAAVTQSVMLGSPEQDVWRPVDVQMEMPVQLTVHEKHETETYSWKF